MQGDEGPSGPCSFPSPVRRAACGRAPARPPGAAAAKAGRTASRSAAGRGPGQVGWRLPDWRRVEVVRPTSWRMQHVLPRSFAALPHGRRTDEGSESARSRRGSCRIRFGSPWLAAHAVQAASRFGMDRCKRDRSWSGLRCGGRRAIGCPMPSATMSKLSSSGEESPGLSAAARGRRPVRVRPENPPFPAVSRLRAVRRGRW